MTEIDRDNLELEMRMLSGDEVTRQIAYLIFGAVATTTRAFGKVEVKIDPYGNKVFIAITLRWWAKYKKMELLRKVWIARAERRALTHVPSGWTPIVYYKRGENGRF